MTQQGFNADLRARERAEQPIVIGETVFHRRRSTNQLQRDVLRIAREQDRVNRRQEKLVDLIDAIDAGKEEETERLKALANTETADVDELTERVDTLADEARHLTLRMISAQLQAVNGGEHPTVEFLEENLDAEDVMPLVKFLSGRPVDPPTPVTSEAGST